MNRFAKHIAFLFIITFGLLYILDFVYTQVYTASTPRNKLQYILKTQNENFDIVFLGSSRVAHHINTSLFDSLSSKKTINLGVEGAGLNDNLLQLKLLLEKNSISNLFLQIDTNYESTEPSTISMSQAMPFLQNTIVRNHIKKYVEDVDRLQYIPFYRYAMNDPKIGFRELFFSTIHKKPKIDPAVGFTPQYDKRDLHGEVLPKTILKSNSVLEEIRAICKENGIKLVVFSSPYCNKTKNLDYIDKLKIKVPDLIDLSEGYTNDLFFDCSHLNNRGAELFTKQLYNATQNILDATIKK